jgi:LysM repeat protein
MKKLAFLSFVILLTSYGLKAQSDSLRTEREGGKVLVVHKVASKQTLFSLARRYGTTVDAINKENPALTNGLQVGQILKIPYGKALLEDASNVTHTVASGETLFAIASKYGVQLDEVKALNDMSSNSLSVGQVLVIKKGIAQEVETAEEEPMEEIPVVVDTLITMTVVTPEVEVIIPDPSDELNSSPFKELLEEGIAELIEEGEATTKFLALHRTAPTGTVIKIRNTMNDLTVYVRVIGRLPDTGDNEKVIIKINKRTYDQLKALDNRFLVELSYFL